MGSVYDELVVVESVFLVPKAGAADVVDGVCDLDEVFEEFAGDVFVGGALEGEFEGDGEHGEAVEAHPCGAVGLVEVAAFGEGVGAVEDADVIEAEEASAEDVASVDVFAVYPPVEVEEEFLEGAFEEEEVALAFFGGDFVDAPDGPGVDGWVYVGEVPFVGGELAVGVHVPFAEEEEELVFREFGVDFGEGDHVECGVPGGEPGVFPLVGHGEDVAGEEVVPVVIAALEACGGGGGAVAVSFEPVGDDVVVELLGPEEAGVALATDEAVVSGDVGGDDVGVEAVGVGDAFVEGLIEVIEAGDVCVGVLVDEAAADLDGFAGGNLEEAVGGCFGAAVAGVEAVFFAVDDVAVEGVFGVGGALEAEDRLVVGLVVGEEPGVVVGGVGGF